MMIGERKRDELLPGTLDRPLIVEGAGGLMVPLTRDILYIDVFASWRAPVVLCARTALGTLNHTLLSLEALQRRRIPILGIALIGDAHAVRGEVAGQVLAHCGQPDDRNLPLGHTSTLRDQGDVTRSWTLWRSIRTAHSMQS